MARIGANKEYNTFIGGIITDASDIAFPENASLDEENFEISKNGPRNRRLGIYEDTDSITDLTDKSSLVPNDFTTLATSSFIWKNSGGNNNYNILVQQIGNDLYFYHTNERSVFEIPLNDGTAITVEGDATKKMSFASLFGYLVVAHDSPGFILISFDSNANLVVETRTLQVRDIWGVDDGLKVDERPETLSLEHKYNLINQGWGGTSRVFGNVRFQYESFYTGRDEFEINVYPSNADILYAVQSPDENGYLSMSESLILEKFAGNTPAPKGHVIIDLFKRGLSRQAFLGNSIQETSHDSESFYWPFGGGGIISAFIASWVENNIITPPEDPVSGNLPVDSSDGFVSNIAAYAGRCWYAINETGITNNNGDSKSPSYTGTVVYSQVIENKDNFSKCYQEGDPTVEGVSDPVATDGGFVRISGADNIKKMVPIKNSLICFATNGIWAISGADEIFSPTSIRITKISEEGVESIDSIVNAEGNILFWGKTGIFSIVPDQISGELSAVNISKDRINNLYFDIDITSRQNAIGIYDSIQRKVRWLYRDSPENVPVEPLKYGNKELILDLVLQAFTRNRIYQDTTTDIANFVVDYIEMPTYVVNTIETTVIVSPDTVVVGADDVIISSYNRASVVEATNIRYVFLRLDTSV